MEDINDYYEKEFIVLEDVDMTDTNIELIINRGTRFKILNIIETLLKRW